MTDSEALLRVLAEREVDFIVVGGVAAIIHGSARSTYDIDIVYLRSGQNIERLVSALAPLNPYLRGAPPGLPFRLDAATVRSGLNFTLTTDLGAIDLFGEIAGGGTYEGLLPDSDPVRLQDHDVLFLNLARLIQVKRAAGRPKDLDAIAELEALQEELNKANELREPDKP